MCLQSEVIKMTFGRKLLEFRAKHNLSQMALAIIIGTSLTNVSRYENEKNEPNKKNQIIYENKMKEWEKK